MVVRKSIDKLDAYYNRLNADKADKIKASHVEAVLDKLQKKLKLLKSEREEAKKDSKKKRIEGKIVVVKEQIKRGKWLLETIQ